MTIYKQAALLLLPTLLYPASATAQAIGQQNTADQNVFSERLRIALISDPSILQEALSALAMKQAKDKKAQFQASVSKLWPSLQQDNGSYIGDKNSSNIVVIFTDYKCKFCDKLAKEVQNFSRDHPAVKFVFKEYPILGENSIDLSILSLDAAKKGKFSQFYQAQFDSSTALHSDADIKASLSNIPASDLAEYRSTIEHNRKIASELAITGTPTIIYDGKRWQGFNEELKKALTR